MIYVGRFVKRILFTSCKEKEGNEKNGKIAILGEKLSKHIKGVGRNPKTGKRKGGIKVHTIIKANENVPCLVRFSAAASHDHLFLDQVHSLAPGSIIIFDKGCLDYARYQSFTEKSIWYVTRQKDNAIYHAQQEFDIADGTDSGILKDEQIVLKYGNKKDKEHCCRRIA